MCWYNTIAQVTFNTRLADYTLIVIHPSLFFLLSSPQFPPCCPLSPHHAFHFGSCLTALERNQMVSLEGFPMWYGGTVMSQVPEQNGIYNNTTLVTSVIASRHKRRTEGERGSEGSVSTLFNVTTMAAAQSESPTHWMFQLLQLSTHIVASYPGSSPYCCSAMRPELTLLCAGGLSELLFASLTDYGLCVWWLFRSLDTCVVPH